ncbi:4-oxalocrotonate tautomerase [Methylobacterium sp. PvP062]|uniref:4-oxalocrotonate tautomerase n=1 Tax=Methylobacterium radiotolerans TaxID=31998 RepID=A0ABV2NCP3_9HYPH|nr:MULTISPECIES: tautomerase family protein [unclassified Methylobacterium]MBP2492528.1 4-oxalocrotonate tautomerase [Methylobacterium sp. PvP105]MBP2501100.1 4-oxalocrotonate tautomerase [Methylobacterium sp. PvP109]MCX7333461.1 tautomerase family protein [Hyphomicrobiales bacterium]
MPFINVKIAGRPLERDQIASIQAGITRLMVDILHKVGPLVGVLVEEVPLAGWRVGGEPVSRVAQVDATVSAGTNTADEKSRFIVEANRLLKTVLGADLTEVSYIVIHEVPKDSWGYDGLTQAERARS